MLYMVVDKFRNQDGKAVYRKLRSGRGLPDGLKFAWVLVRQVVSVAVRRAFHRKGVVGRGRSAS